MYGATYCSEDTVTAEAELVARFVSGDPEAVRDLYHRYSRPMFAVALRSLGDRGLAEEAVQQSFLQAWQASSRFDPDRDVAPWLFTITKRVAVDLFRRERRHGRQGPLDDQLAELPPGLEAAWITWEVRRALDTMPREETRRARSHPLHRADPRGGGDPARDPGRDGEVAARTGRTVASPSCSSISRRRRHDVRRVPGRPARR